MRKRKYRPDDESQSYQEKLDNLAFLGKVPEENQPFAFEDFCESVFEFLSNLHFIGLALLIVLGFYFTGSVIKTCAKCHINRTTFYKCRCYLMRYYKSFPGGHHKLH